jgi:hypothetical protein
MNKYIAVILLGMCCQKFSLWISKIPVVLYLFNCLTFCTSQGCIILENFFKGELAWLMTVYEIYRMLNASYVESIEWLWDHFIDMYLLTWMKEKAGKFLEFWKKWRKSIEFCDFSGQVWKRSWKLPSCLKMYNFAHSGISDIFDCIPDSLVGFLSNWCGQSHIKLLKNLVTWVSIK